MELTKKEAEELAKKIIENSKKHGIPLRKKKTKKDK
ncbi:type III secretion system FlhB-like substrate exporter [Cytobacillus kochii]|nr:type III secretion system FlhB-like substrate exporter [Cytobacillus kochii]